MRLWWLALSMCLVFAAGAMLANLFGRERFLYQTRSTCSCRFHDSARTTERAMRA